MTGPCSRRTFISTAAMALGTPAAKPLAASVMKAPASPVAIGRCMDYGTPPFEKCDSTLRLAEDLGVGTRDLTRIEVIGTPIAKARYRFPALSTLPA